jgi:hypothetical protein
MRARMAVWLGHTADRDLELRGRDRRLRVETHHRCADCIFCRPVPNLLVTDAPAHRHAVSFGMSVAIRLFHSRRTTSRASGSGAPFTAGSRRSEERRAATPGLARGRRSLPTCCSRAALRARHASVSRPDVPHAAHRLLSIEHAASTPRTPATRVETLASACHLTVAPVDPKIRGAIGRFTPFEGRSPLVEHSSPARRPLVVRIYPQWVVVRTPRVACRCPEPLEDDPGGGAESASFDWPRCSTRMSSFLGTPAEPRRETVLGKRFPGCLEPPRSVWDPSGYAPF